MQGSYNCKVSCILLVRTITIIVKKDGESLKCSHRHYVLWRHLLDDPYILELISSFLRNMNLVLFLFIKGTILWDNKRSEWNK
jgi:hypothetical protein